MLTLLAESLKIFRFKEKKLPSLFLNRQERVELLGAKLDKNSETLDTLVCT